MKLQFSRQIFDKILNTRFHKNLSSGSRIVPCGRTHEEDRVAFRKFANAPKNFNRSYKHPVLMTLLHTGLVAAPVYHWYVTVTKSGERAGWHSTQCHWKANVLITCWEHSRPRNDIIRSEIWRYITSKNEKFYIANKQAVCVCVTGQKLDNTEMPQASLICKLATIDRIRGRETRLKHK